MGILNRTPDSFYDRGATWDFDAFVRRAEQLVADGADLLDVGGVKAGPGPGGRRERGARPRRSRGRGAAGPLRRSAVGRHLAGIGARRRVRGGRGRRQRHLRLRRSRLPARRGEARRHRRRHAHPPAARASPIPNRTTTISSPTSPRSSSTGRARAEAVGLRPEQIVLDAGLDLGKTPGAECGAAPGERAARDARLSAPALRVEQALHRRAARPRDRRSARRSRSPRSRTASMHGCRIVRVHDVLGNRARLPHDRGVAVSIYARAGRRSAFCATARCSGSSTSCSVARIARSRSTITRSRAAGARATPRPTRPTTTTTIRGSPKARPSCPRSRRSPPRCRARRS